MAQGAVLLDQETFSCSICLDLPKDLVTISCGHSYCFSCIKEHWDGEEEKGIYSCPQCRKEFMVRPELIKSTMLAALVEELKKTGLQDAPADHGHAGAEDVACDVCTGRKLKALKSCLVCLASYCDTHLQRHRDVAPLRKHQLVDPSKNLLENVCSQHDEVIKMFCRSDQQCICYLCSVDEHKGHDIVSAAAERRQKQEVLQDSRRNIQQRIQDREEDVKVLEQEVKDINLSADEAVQHSQKICTELIRLMAKRSSDVRQQIRSQQEAEVSKVKELQQKLEQEITELRSKDAELQQLSNTEDHCHFLHNYSSVSQVAASTHLSRFHIRPCRYFEEVRAAVSESSEKLLGLLRDTWTNISQTKVDALLSANPEPKTRAHFLRYSCGMTLDPNTAHLQLPSLCRDVPPSLPSSVPLSPPPSPLPRPRMLPPLSLPSCPLPHPPLLPPVPLFRSPLCPPLFTPSSFSSVYLGPGHKGTILSSEAQTSALQMCTPGVCTPGIGTHRYNPSTSGHFCNTSTTLPGHPHQMNEPSKLAPLDVEEHFRKA